MDGRNFLPLGRCGTDETEFGKFARSVQSHACLRDVIGQRLAVLHGGHPLLAVDDVRHGTDIGPIAGDDRPFCVFLVIGIAVVIR